MNGGVSCEYVQCFPVQRILTFPIYLFGLFSCGFLVYPL
jgi:hypothetical protein